MSSDNATVKKRVELATSKIVGLLEKVDAFWGSESTPPNPPASQDAIAAVEKRLGQPLPVDYRTFLELHDGWPMMAHFLFLSTAQLLDPEEFGDPADDDNSLKGGAWLIVSVEEDTGYCLRPANESWEVVEVHQSEPDDPTTFVEVVEELAKDAEEWAEEA